MKRRLFLTGTAGAALGLVGCGGGGSGADVAAVDPLNAVTGSTPAAPDASPAPDVSAPAQPAPEQTAPAQPEETPAQPTPTGLPARVLACYYTAWDSSYAITDVPLEFNVIYLFNAQNGGTNTGDGSWTWPFSYAVSSAQIQQVRQRGQKVILTVGGAGLGFSYRNRTQSTNCVNSIKSIIASLGGVDGVDFNNYEAGIGASPAEMVWIAQQLIIAYGPDFAITTPPQPNDPNDMALCKAMADAGVLTYAAPQFYDWSGFNDPGYISGRISQWVAALGDSKVAIGLSANYSNGPSLDDCTREWRASVVSAPRLRGAFCWSAQTNLAGGNLWGKTLKGVL